MCVCVCVCVQTGPGKLAQQAGGQTFFLGAGQEKVLINSGLQNVLKEMERLS